MHTHGLCGKKKKVAKKGSVRGMGNLPTKMKGKSKNSLTSRIINRTDWNQNLVKRINSNNLFINNRQGLTKSTKCTQLVVVHKH